MYYFYSRLDPGFHSSVLALEFSKWFGEAVNGGRSEDEQI